MHIEVKHDYIRTETRDVLTASMSHPAAAVPVKSFSIQPGKSFTRIIRMNAVERPHFYIIQH